MFELSEDPKTSRTTVREFADRQQRRSPGLSAVLITGTCEPDDIAAVMAVLCASRAGAVGPSKLVRWQAQRRSALRRSRTDGSSAQPSRAQCSRVRYSGIQCSRNPRRSTHV
jgi:hypothetical protein